jgi:hypothetical protein
MGYKEDLQKVHKKIDDLANSLPAQAIQSEKACWYRNPLLLGIAQAIVAGLVAYGVARWQVGQAREDADIDRRIENQVNAKIQPINDAISKLREDVAYLRAKVEDATKRKVVRFSKMPASEVEANLADISRTIRDARDEQIIPPPEAIVELRNKLAQVQTRNPEFWVAFSNVISFQSLVAERLNIFPNAEQARNNPCQSLITVAPGVKGAFVKGITIESCSQELDGGSWEDCTFQDTIVVYRGGPVHLKNVTFKNCIFDVSFPKVPSPPAQKIGQALLVATGLVPTFTISAG